MKNIKILDKDFNIIENSSISLMIIAFKRE